MANQIKRHFYNHQHYELDFDNQVVTLLPGFYEKLKNKKLWGKFGFKKIGGSSIGDVLEVDQFKSQFSAYCRMTWIGLPVLDRKYVDAGIAIEPKVVEAIEQMTKSKVTTFDPYQYNFDYFANKDDVVGGLPDGFIESKKLILEIKTTGEKNYQKWATFGIPTGYLKQAQLYAYLMKVDHYAIVATFLQEQDYLDPQNYPIEKRKLKNWNFVVNKAQAEDDINKVKTWYSKYTTSLNSPRFDLAKDQDLLTWLAVSNEKEWEELKKKWILEGKIVL